MRQKFVNPGGTRPSIERAAIGNTWVDLRPDDGRNRIDIAARERQANETGRAVVVLGEAVDLL